MDEFMQASTPLAHELANSALRLCCITAEVTVKMPFKFSSEECNEYMGVHFVYRFCSDNAIGVIEVYQQ
jgi:hypothetical protein